MNSILPLLCLVCFAFACTQQKPTNIPELQQDIEQELGKTAGDFAVAFKELDQPQEELLINAREDFHAASTMKTPVLIEVYQQAAAGKFNLTDSLTVKNEFKSIVDSSRYALNPEDDSFRELYDSVGHKQSIYDLTYDMIIASSNLATNIMIELVGADQVTQSMRALGANDMQVLRGVEDIKAYRQGLNNTTTAYDQTLLMEAIANGQAVSKEASQAMTAILLDQQFNDIIPAQLPGDVKVAHKTGWITGVHHDAAIVFLPDGRKYVLVLLSKNLKDEKAGIKTLATVSKMIYDYVMRD